MDSVFLETPTVDSGETVTQLYIGTQSLLLDVYPLKAEKQFVNGLQDNI